MKIPSKPYTFIGENIMITYRITLLNFICNFISPDEDVSICERNQREVELWTGRACDIPEHYYMSKVAFISAITGESLLPCIEIVLE